MMGWNCGAWSDAALPRWGKGRCGVRRRRCLPRWGKGAAVWRAWFWLVRGEMLFMRRFALQEGLAGAPGGGEKPLCVFARILQGLADAPGARGDGGRWALRARRKLPALPAAASFSQPSRGETGGLCPHPPKGPVPWESLFGEPGHLPRLPVSPKRRRRQVPARGLAAVCTLTAPPETQRSIHAPCSWGMDASSRSRRRWPPALPALPAWHHPSTADTGARPALYASMPSMLPALPLKAMLYHLSP